MPKHNQLVSVPKPNCVVLLPKRFRHQNHSIRLKLCNKGQLCLSILCCNGHVDMGALMYVFCQVTWYKDVLFLKYVLHFPQRLSC